MYIIWKNKFFRYKIIDNRVFVYSIDINNIGLLDTELLSFVKKYPYVFIPPIDANIIINNVCNMNCSYCFLPKENQKKELESPSDLIKVLYSLGIRRFSISGTEPLLSKDILIDIMKTFYKLSSMDKLMHMAIFTNGTLLDEEVIENMKKYNIFLIISIHNLKTIKSINLCKIKNFKCGASIVLSAKDTIHNIEKIIKNINNQYKNTIVEISITPAKPTYFTKDIVPSPNLIEKAKKSSIISPYLVELEIPQAEPRHPLDFLRYLYCSLGISGVAINVDCAVYPCTSLLGLSKYKLIENILDEYEEFLECWIKHPILERLRNVWKEISNCKECKYLNYCFGGCKLGYEIFGDNICPHMLRLIRN